MESASPLGIIARKSKRWIDYDRYYESAIAPVMLNYNPLHCLPAAEDLPDSDDEPVDNQLQHLIPGLLEAILAWLWASRMDWFFRVDMGI
ncbi:hypothetical protein I8752_19050 [Nostocaceae cyanobacterium CENA369]|uniref:Uncharacterized protein n=1 Tax=Dendronalium phyllosphericum CENA369 TaxID=1725256 RepID=A0A8J7I8G3_9NOST|nr:hypothetical protein [Dendronalium phyllosphericum]MBH8575076.1 hypothetical protein [Dendronalium phyllosphericum CENA369]